MVRWRAFLIVIHASAVLASNAVSAHYVGPETCALCHKDIATRQTRTAMANTWQGRATSWLSPSFKASPADDLSYELNRNGEAISYSFAIRGEPKMSFAVDMLVGGRRHGVGFLIPIRQIDGMPLARPALIQARYAWSADKKKLLLAPGCTPDQPQSLESALGLTLSPTFESRCLSCHVQPNREGAGKEGGVHCESCHGPGSNHLAAVGRGTPDKGIVNPARWPAEDSITVCARCHVGLARFADPSADDLLVANQVRAIKSSECFLQSRKKFSCTACHDPHSDGADDDARTIKTCLGCHAADAKPHAAICPLNAIGGCIGCHMPSVELGALHLVDHQIRVHPEQGMHASYPDVRLKTQIEPISEYLRIITVNTAQVAAALRDRMERGESFYQLARDNSIDRTAAIGGYLGRKGISTLEGGLSIEAARLGYGESSPVVQSGDRYLILQRLSRDFRWDAEQLQKQAEELAARGDGEAAIGKAQAALKIYPHFLRSINFIANVFAQSGNAGKAVEVLSTAAHLYPDDAATRFALASELDLLGDQAKASDAYKRVIALDADFTPAYVKLGMILYSAGAWRGAVGTFRQGLQIDPLCAELYYDLGLALARSGDADGATQANSLAHKLDPVF